MAIHPPIEAKNISKFFGTKQVLDDVSFSVKEGEIFGLIGLNGVGKTTLIKIFLNLLAADEGESSFYGIDTSNKQSRSNISYLPEKFYPSQFLKGEEFLSLALSYYNKNYDHELATKYALELDLAPEALKNKISKYSKGMGQKLGLLSVFLSEAPLLVLDEPMSGLDPSARIQLKNLLLNYVKSRKTVFFSSHILADIDEICDRIAVIDNARLIFCGTPAEFKTKYSNDNSLEKAFLSSLSTKQYDNQ